MSEIETPVNAPPADGRQAARAFLDARGFAPGPSPFRAIVDALADGFAESEGPLQIPLALALFGEEVMAAFPERTGPLSFAELRRTVAAVAAQFPQVTAEYVRVVLNVLEGGGLLESAYREIDPDTGAATDRSAEAVVALLHRAQAPGPDGVAASERLARITLEWRVRAPQTTASPHDAMISK
jgi:hypothetical protein